MAAAKPDQQVRVRVHLTAANGDFGIFYGGQEYTVSKAAAAWLLEDPRVATPVGKADPTERR